MNSLVPFAIAVALVGGFFTASPTSAQSPLTGKGVVVSVREFDLNAGVDPAEFEKFATEKFNPALEGAIPGVRAFLSKGHTGNSVGRYAYIVIYDALNTKGAYITLEGTTPTAATPALNSFKSKIDPYFTELWKYAPRSKWRDIDSDYAELR